MQDNTNIIGDAFRMIEAAIGRADGGEGIDAALDAIGDALNLIEPALLAAAEDLSAAEIGETLAGFVQRSKRASGDDRPGNTPEQAMLAMVALAEIRRRARQDGLPTLEWCRRERIRGFLHD